VEIGEHCIVVAQVGIAGSTTLGRYVTMAGQSGAGGHLHIGDQTVVAARGGVTKNLPARSVVAGMPARDAKTHQKEEIASRRLPGLQTTIKDLVARVAELESKLASETDGGAA
jgi:UDP-3-O-[3-hydroxymyristoyl] glucosamine N-acyltransferase